MVRESARLKSGNFSQYMYGVLQNSINIWTTKLIRLSESSIHRNTCLAKRELYVSVFDIMGRSSLVMGVSLISHIEAYLDTICDYYNKPYLMYCDTSNRA